MYLYFFSGHFFQFYVLKWSDKTLLKAKSEKDRMDFRTFSASIATQSVKAHIHSPTFTHTHSHIHTHTHTQTLQYQLFKQFRVKCLDAPRHFLPRGAKELN